MNDLPGSHGDSTYSAYPSSPQYRPEYVSDHQVQTLLRQIREELRKLRALMQERHEDSHPLEDIKQHLRELRDIIKFWVEEERQRKKSAVDAAREHGYQEVLVEQRKKKVEQNT